jgi:hypothetical protein
MGLQKRPSGKIGDAGYLTMVVFHIENQARLKVNSAGVCLGNPT